jgi:hypothetical protein
MDCSKSGEDFVCDAGLDDISAMAALEMENSKIPESRITTAVSETNSTSERSVSMRIRKVTSTGSCSPAGTRR